MKEYVQLVIFTLRFDNKSVYFGIPMEQVKEINCIIDIIQIPQSLEFLVGMIKVRGEFIPIIDLKNKFLLDDKIVNNKNSRIIIFETNGSKAGLIVDELSEVLQVPTSTIRVSSSFSNMSLPYLSGMAKMDDRIIIVLDLKEILSEIEEETLQSLDLHCM